MRITVPVFQRKLGDVLTWTTLGLGDLTQQRVGRSPVKMQKKLSEQLRDAIRELEPRQLRSFEMARGIRLEHLGLDVRIKGPRRRKVSGRFPVIFEPRRRTEADPLLVAYHPLRQESWTPIDDTRPVVDQVARFFAGLFEPLEDLEIEDLKHRGRESVRAVAFSVLAPSLLDQLPDDRSDPWADLEIDPNREQKKKTRRRRKHRHYPALRQVGVNLTLRAADETLEMGRPREPLRTQLAQLLTGTRKTPTVLLGPPGVGKRTLLRRLVGDLLVTDDFFVHRNLDEVTEVWSVSARRIIAGMSRIGEWEERCVQLLQQVRGQKVVLWVEDLHTFGRAGRSRDSDRCLADLFRGPIARGELCVVAACTPSQWHVLQEDAASFAEVFTTVTVTPTEVPETVQMLLHEARRLERQRPEVRIAPLAFRTMLELGATLFTHTAMPGTALDLLRRLARHARGAVGPREVIELLARRTGLPDALLSADARLDVDELERAIGRRVLGQPGAVGAAVDLVARIQVGLTDRRRPYATYLFTGPTGTGKTELAKVIAEYLYGDRRRLLRFDMGELSGPDAVARLIGDRWSPRGLLTEAIQQQPFAVVLLDEIEKAHPAVLYLLLQLFDEGRLTDAAGDTADFTHAVVVMTSNLGARTHAAVGFGDAARHVIADVARAVKDFFPPELFNRIDRVVPFHPLDPKVAAAIAEKELALLLARRGLTERNVFVFAHESAARRMVEQAFDARDGARSVKRYLEEHVGSLLSEELARGQRASMQIVRLYATEAGYRIHVDPLVEAAPESGEPGLAPLLDLPVTRLTEHLPGALAFTRELEDSGVLDSLGEHIREHLEAQRRGEPGHEEAIYQLDAIRREVRAFHDHLEAWVQGSREAREARLEIEHGEVRRRAPGDGRAVRVLDRRWIGGATRRLERDDVLHALAEVAFLRRALPRAHDEAEHTVVVELLRVGSGRTAAGFGATPEGLIHWLAGFYADRRGELLELAVRLDDGRVTVVRDPEAPKEVLAGPVAQVVMKIGGLCVRELYEAEAGCHVWTSLLSGSEVVRVRALPEGPTCEEVIASHVAAAAAFEAALERGDDPLPEDPGRLAPAVRRLRFDPPLRAGEAAEIEIEDYPLAHVEVARVKRLADVLPRLWLLRMSRAPSDPD